MSNAYLRVYGNGEFGAKNTAEFLQRLNSCYVNLVDLERILDLSDLHKNRSFYIPTLYRNERVAVFGELKIHSVEFHSPGFWEFLGKLNPLEVIRQYLSDEHERKKDKEYRNNQEKNQLELENKIRELEYFKMCIETLKDSGWSEQEVQTIIRERLFIPLRDLDILKEQGAIKKVVLVEEDEDSDGPPSKLIK